MTPQKGDALSARHDDKGPGAFARHFEQGFTGLQFQSTLAFVVADGQLTGGVQ